MKRKILNAVLVSVLSVFGIHQSIAQERAITLANDVKWIPMVAELGEKGPVFSVVFCDLNAKGLPLGIMVKVPAGTV